jgi:type II secretory pathway pseudopilin PulG
MRRMTAIGGIFSAGESARTGRRFRRDGITLLEIMLVLALLVAIGAMAMPMLNGPLENHRLRRSGDIIRAEWTRLRVRAMEKGQTYVFRYQVSGSTYMTQLWSADEDYLESSAAVSGLVPPLADTAAGTSGSGVADAAQSKQLPENIMFVGSESLEDTRGDLLAGEPYQAPSAEGEWSDPVFFYPDGTTSTVRLVLANQRQRSLVLTLRGLTGVVNISDGLPTQDLP